MTKLKMQSKSKIEENLGRIKELFPNCVTEVKKDGKVTHAIDFGMLKQELSDIVVEHQKSSIPIRTTQQTRLLYINQNRYFM